MCFPRTRYRTRWLGTSRSKLDPRTWVRFLLGRLCIVGCSDSEGRLCIVGCSDSEGRLCIVGCSDSEGRLCIVGCSDSECEKSRRAAFCFEADVLAYVFLLLRVSSCPVPFFPFPAVFMVGPPIACLTAPFFPAAAGVALMDEESDLRRCIFDSLQGAPRSVEAWRPWRLICALQNVVHTHVAAL
eukprot:SAG11_NODE_764_length_7290_cov_9.187596_3_plen_185_part_00